MSGCGGEGGCGPSRPQGPASPAPSDLPAGALYVVQKSIVIAAGSPEQTVFTLPPAAAVDVFIQYRNPTTGSLVDPSATSRFSIYATQQLLSYRVDRNSAANVSTTNRRILAVRDLPVDRYEVKADGVLLADANGAYYDVVAIGWGKEPTAIGPLPLSEWVDGQTVPAAGRNVGLPLLSVDDGDTIVVLHAGDTNLHSAAFELNTLPCTEYLVSANPRSDGQRGPLESDSVGNLKVTLQNGTSATFPAPSALADADANPTTTRVGADNLFYNGATWDRGRSGFITAGTPTGWQNALACGVFNTAAPSLTNGQAITLQLTSAGNLKVVEQQQPLYEDNTNGVAATQILPLANTTYTYSRDIDFGTVTKKNTKASAGNVYGFTVENTNAAARYFQIHNKATAPAATDVPIYSIRVASNEVREIGTDFFGPAGINLATGIGWAWSTTKATFTDAATAADHTTHVHYK